MAKDKDIKKLYETYQKLEIAEARENFYSFCKYMDNEFFTPNKPHLKIICQAFQDIADGKIKKLAISLPPRAGKSYCTSLFCAWWLGENPRDGIMRNSYGAELAEGFSYSIREMVQSEKYLKVFPKVKLKADKKNVSDWAFTTAKQTSYFCAGVGGAITGKGAKMAILDDPLKNIEDALSDAVVEKTWNWYTSTHMSRLEKNGVNIHIATRWSKKDPIGRLTDPYSPFYDKDFKVIVIPALDSEGKSFCEEIKSTEEYYDLKKITEGFIWEAEFMQNPVEEKGLLFSMESLNKFKMSEIQGKTQDGVIGFTDTADRGSDYLCSLIGKQFGRYTYITDVVFTQLPIEVTEALVAQQIIDTKCEIMKIESNSGGRSFARNVRTLAEKKWYCQIIDEATTSNKETRILMNSGYVREFFYFRTDYLPGSDYDKYMRQLTSYVLMGRNTHDDATDATCMLGEYVKVLNFDKPSERKRLNSHYTFEKDEERELEFDKSYVDFFVN